MNTTYGVALLDTIAEAVGFVVQAGPEAVERMAYALEDGHLAIDIEVCDGESYALVRDVTEVCWDGCDGITNYHRSGWCRFVPEHADRDCSCGEGLGEFYDESDYDAVEAAEFDAGWEIADEISF